VGIFGWFKRQPTGLLRSEDGGKLDVNLRIKMRRELQDFLEPQIEQLNHQNVRVCINEITAAYIMNLLAVSHRQVNPHDACAAAKAMFPQTEENQALVDNAFQVLAYDSQAREKLAGTHAITLQEVAVGKYEFLVRHSKKTELAQQAQSKRSGRIDLSKEPSWSSKDLA
jgi:hypothetical protein